MIHTFNDLKSHKGHNITCVTYGEDHNVPVNVALECEDCGCVLIDLEAGQTVGVDDDGEAWANGEKIAIVWGIQDVYDRADEKNIEIDSNQAIQILADMKRQEDSSIGITWDTIDSHLDELTNTE